MSIYVSSPSPSSSFPFLRHQDILPDLTPSERVSHLKNQLDTLSDMLIGAEDCKWIYEALLRYTIVLNRSKESPTPRAAAADSITGSGISSAASDDDVNGGDDDNDDEEKKKMRIWLGELRRLDPLRRGRWNDLAESIER